MWYELPVSNIPKSDLSFCGDAAGSRGSVDTLVRKTTISSASTRAHAADSDNWAWVLGSHQGGTLWSYSEGGWEEDLELSLALSDGAQLAEMAKVVVELAALAREL